MSKYPAQINVRLTHEQKKEIETIADQLGVNVNQLIREGAAFYGKYLLNSKEKALAS